MQANLIIGTAAKFFAREIPTSAVAKKLAARGGSIRLKHDEVIRLDKSSRVIGLKVKGGYVWITGSPANGDVMVSAGEQFDLRDRWPFVIQALGPAQLFLCPDDLQTNGLANGRARSAFGHYVSMC